MTPVTTSSVTTYGSIWMNWYGMMRVISRLVDTTKRQAVEKAENEAADDGQQRVQTAEYDRRQER